MPLSLETYLQLALAIGTAIPFDAASALMLVSELDGTVDLRLPLFLDAALQEKLDALDDADLYREAIARAALCYLVAALRRRLLILVTEAVAAPEAVRAG